MLKFKFCIKDNASQMDQRFYYNVSSGRKNLFSCHVFILFGKLSISSFSSSSLFNAMFFCFFNVMFKAFYHGAFLENESDIAYMQCLYNQWRNWVKTWPGAFSRLLSADIGVNWGKD